MDPTRVLRPGVARESVWHPDFHLDEYGFHVEYAGIQKGETKEQYANRIKFKKAAYERSGVKVAWLTRDDLWEEQKDEYGIPIKNEDGEVKYVLRKDYQERILKKIQLFEDDRQPHYGLRSLLSDSGSSRYAA